MAESQEQFWASSEWIKGSTTPQMGSRHTFPPVRPCIGTCRRSKEVSICTRRARRGGHDDRRCPIQGRGSPASARLYALQTVIHGAGQVWLACTSRRSRGLRSRRVDQVFLARGTLAVLGNLLRLQRPSERHHFGVVARKRRRDLRRDSVLQACRG